MRYHYKKPDISFPLYGEVYYCNHKIYNVCTLFRINELGLSVIQQRFDTKEKVTYWTDIDPYLINDIYLNPNFIAYFNKYAAKSTDGLYPTVTIRQLMYGLKMKPLKKNIWETVFDHHI